MKFRPCIDIHNGKVKQIVGGSLSDEGEVSENFVSERDADHYARLYAGKGLSGGHVILLDKKGTDAYEQDLEQARLALGAHPGTLQVGGGIDPENAEAVMDMVASYMIFTSFEVSDGEIRLVLIDDFAVKRVFSIHHSRNIILCTIIYYNIFCFNQCN